MTNIPIHKTTNKFWGSALSQAADVLIEFQGSTSSWTAHADGLIKLWYLTISCILALVIYEILLSSVVRRCLFCP